MVLRIGADNNDIEGNGNKVELEIIAVYKNLDEYIWEMEKEGADYKSLWDKYAIQPYWEKISRWAPFDMSERKPQPVRDISQLRQQVEIMKSINLEEMRNRFMQVIDLLPNYDDDPITVAIYPLGDDNLTVKEKQNGVWGVNVFGNIILNINPFSQNYLEWIPYVFAHEYHHTVWGNYWNVIHGGRTGKFLESMLIDGEADAFARSLNPSLNPKWISQIPDEQEKKLWDRYYSRLINETNADYIKCMLGDDESGIPWCTGYFFGYRIIEYFKRNYPLIGIKQMIEMDAEEIYCLSGYGQNN